MPTPSTKIIPLGGIEEFGNNSFIFEYGNDIILIDFGLKFAKQPSYGVNYWIPNIRYLENNADRIRGIIFTHGHLDHIGGAPYLLRQLNIPIYASKFTALLIHQAFERLGVKDYKMTLLKTGKKVTLGAFEVEPVRIEHSIPDTMSLMLRSPTGLFIHSGDFRSDLHPYKRDKNTFDGFFSGKKEQVLALFSDSTNAGRPGRTVSEQEVYTNLEKIFKANTSRRIVFSTFSTQIDRIRKILDLALKNNRKVFFVGRSMITNLGIAIRGQFLEKYNKIIVPLKDYKKHSSAKSILIVTGSQGEENSALIKISQNKHKDVTLNKKDLIVFSSSVIPGNEVTVTGLKNSLVKNGYLIISNDDLPIHTSGHGYADELSLLIKKLKPKFFFPIHGDYINLKEHKEIAIKKGTPAENIFLMENGQRVEVFKDRVKFTEKIKIPKVAIEHERVSSSDPNTYEARKQLSDHGVIFISTTMRQNFKGNQSPFKTINIEMMGVAGGAVEASLTKFIQKELQALALEKFSLEDEKEPKKKEKKIKQFVKRIVENELGSLPIIRVSCT